jgi:DNA-binding IclR family transcriptional regulator
MAVGDGDEKGAKDGPNYQAPALEKGLDIVELLARSGVPLSRSDIAVKLERSVGELYRMLHQLVQRNYIALVGDSYVLTVYSQGKQLVIAKVDVPSGMGFSVRVGSELDVLVSASGRVLLAFQDAETRSLRIEEAHVREPGYDLEVLDKTLSLIAKRGFEAAPSGQVKGLYAISCPILDLRSQAIAALTVPYADRIDQRGRKSLKQVEVILGEAASQLTARLSGI